MTSHQVETQHIKDLSFNSRIDLYDISMDTTDPEKTLQAGPSPKKLMLASLAGCSGIDVVSILNKMKVHFTEFDIRVTGVLSDDHPVIYKEVSMVYSIKINDADQQKMEKAVQLSQEKYCGVSAMFKSFAKVSWSIEFL
jgi:putative redox protein